MCSPWADRQVGSHLSGADSAERYRRAMQAILTGVEARLPALVDSSPRSASDFGAVQLNRVCSLDRPLVMRLAAAVADHALHGDVALSLEQYHVAGT